jgi:hypothetical protein
MRSLHVLRPLRLRRRLVPLLAISPALLALSVGLLSSGVSSAAPAPLPWLSGAYVAPAQPLQDQAFGTWRGRPITAATDFIDNQQWSDIAAPLYTASQWTAFETSVSTTFSIPPWPVTGGSLAAAAAGNYNLYYQKMAQTFIDKGDPNTTLRFAWEFNGSWMKWGVHNAADAANYAAMWRQFVTSVRSVAGGRFKFEWTIANNAYSTVLPAASYPGSSYVDYIGDDVYDIDYQHIGHCTVAQRWSDLLTENGDGLSWAASFAASEGVPVAIPEWGVSDQHSGTSEVGGGDDPTFISAMFSWLGSHNVAAESYFDTDASAANHHDLRDGEFPLASAEYTQLFG